jgi:hypothetical protein
VDFHVVPGRTALVNVDLQNFFVENAPDGLTVLEPVNQFAVECRKAGMLVIHTSPVLRPTRRDIRLGARVDERLAAVRAVGVEAADAALAWRGARKCAYRGPFALVERGGAGDLTGAAPGALRLADDEDLEV